MTRKKRRAVLIATGLTLIGGAAGLMGWAFQTKVTFFMTPSEVLSGLPKPGMSFRVGGLVEAGTCHKLPDAVVVFRLTDGSKSLPVTYRGILPDLFREKQGVVALGELGPDGVFVASNVLAKHDEKYMPPEVADALKKSGHWQKTAITSQGSPCT
jgi:cytochrome c-type biogenesis protein CcmE